MGLSAQAHKPAAELAGVGVLEGVLMSISCLTGVSGFQYSEPK